ncbi:MAG: 2-succinyl-5-enolpyruvyl-6-hydroxy-3-cyclohexene-1-carboxylic-acid synthase [Deltaproteobacteria bacterium]|nr:2-succinyl-5-enolpyruvyl-6-hydroxy-3-cyclohexene-1-carboxylic-acid synthase [Deltaproteobacteria bacterium]
MIQAANVNHLWATLLVEELIRNGIGTFCIAPGSRSTPLVVAVARNPRARAVVHYDERGAAFHALGYGRATGMPAVVVTTSGSALANAWPAVVEASLERVPLLVLSGDRPPELQDAGANQTMDQVKFFGGYAEWSATLPCPSTDVDPAVVLTTVDQAVSRCRGPAGGAVHINCMFREPLAPTEQGEDFGVYLEPLRAWHEGGHAYTRYESVPSRRASELPAEFAGLVARRPRGLLVAGGLASAAERAAVADLAEALGWPFLPDVTSGLRLDGRTATLVPYHEVLLGSAEFMRDHPVEAVIHLGGRWTSRRLPDHLEVAPPKDYVVVNEQPDRADPVHRATLRFQLPVAEFCEALSALVGNTGTAVDAASGAAREAGGAPDAGWLASWRRASDHVGGRIDALLTRDRTLSEPKVARLVSRHIGGGEGLYLASSMPVRDMDTFGCPRPVAVVVAANRGASGVDGTIATATGFARGLDKGVTLVIGDQAFLHDLNSLRLCRSLDHPFVIVVLNNDGGGIFSFLSIARFPDVFEPYFGASHGMTFEHAAALFGLEYAVPSTADEFVDAYAQARGRGGATIIEVRTARGDNVDLHARLRREAVAGLTSPLSRT